MIALLFTIQLLLNPCHPSDTILWDSTTYDKFNGFQYVYSTNAPSLYTDTFGLNEADEIIWKVPAPTPIGVVGPAFRIVNCYNEDVENLYADGRMTRPAPTTTTTTTTPPVTTTTTAAPVVVAPKPAPVWKIMSYGVPWTIVGHFNVKA